MERGEREWGHRGDEGYKACSVRGSNDERRDPADPEHDPYPNMRDDYEDLQDPANDDYILTSRKTGA